MKKIIIYFYLFNIIFFAYMITSPGSLGGDNDSRFILAKMIARKHTLVVDKQYENKIQNYLVYNDKKEAYVFYAPLASLFFAVSIKLLDIIQTFIHIPPVIETNVYEFIISMWGGIWGFFTLLGLFFILRLYKFPYKIAFFTMLVAGFSTNFWILVVSVSNNVLQSMFLVWSLYFLLKFYKFQNNFSLFLSGVNIAFAILARTETALISFCLGIVFIVYFYRKYLFFDALKKYILFMIPQVIGVIFILFYNFIRFNDFFNFGVPSVFNLNLSLLKGIYYNLFHSSIGLITNNPIFILGVIIVILKFKGKIFDSFFNSMVLIYSVPIFLLSSKFSSHLVYSEFGPRLTIYIVMFLSLYWAYVFMNKQKIMIYLIVIFTVIELICTTVVADRIYYYFKDKDMDKVALNDLRYTRWITQVGSAYDVITKMFTQNNLELQFNFGENVDKNYFYRHSVAFNFVIYWWARLYFLHIPIIIIFLIPAFIILFIIYNFIKLMKVFDFYENK